MRDKTYKNGYRVYMFTPEQQDNIGAALLSAAGIPDKDIKKRKGAKHERQV